MSNEPRAVVERQVRRVRRRLFAQVVVQSIAIGWAAALGVTALWFLVRPFAFAGLGETAHWGVPGMLLVAGTLGGLVLAWMRRPNLVESALALDEKFGLQERVTTLLTLPDESRASPAGQALLEDVSKRLAAVEMAGQFPLRLSLRQWLMPAGALVLALVACLFEPILSNLDFGSRASATEARKAVNVKEIQDKMENLKKVVNERNQEHQTNSEQLKELEKEFEKLINQPLDAKSDEKIRERISAMRKLEDKMKERLDGLKEKTEKIDQLKKQLEKLSLDKNAKLKDGPAKDFEDALMKGQLDKAKDVLEKLVKDLKKGALSQEKQKELKEQFQQLQDKLKRLMDNDELMKQLKQDAKDGKIDAEGLKREMEKFKDLQDLTDVLGECKECLDKQNSKEAGEKLEKLLERFEQTELTEEEIRDILRDQDEVDEAMRLLRAQMEGDEGGDGMDGGERAGGKRPIDAKDPDGKIKNERQKAHVDPKGQQRLTGYAKGGTFNKIPAKAVEGAFRQAVQEAPDALDRQRIPADAADIAKGYFQKLGNQK